MNSKENHHPRLCVLALACVPALPSAMAKVEKSFRRVYHHVPDRERSSFPFSNSSSFFFLWYSNYLHKNLSTWRRVGLRSFFPASSSSSSVFYFDLTLWIISLFQEFYLFSFSFVNFSPFSRPLFLHFTLALSLLIMCPVKKDVDFISWWPSN